jgi:MFS family permease
MISQIGDRFTQMAFIELLGAEFFGSFAAFGGVAVVFTLPSILLGPITGPLIDSWRKKRVLVTADLLRGGLILSLPFVYQLSHSGGAGSLIPMLGVALVVYVFGFFFNSARLAYIPLIVPQGQYLEANSANLTLLRVATGLGTVAGGFTVHFIGWRLGFFFDAITYLVSFILILFIVVKERPHEKDIRDMVRERMTSYWERIKKSLDFILDTFNMVFIRLVTLPVIYFWEFVKNEFVAGEPRPRREIDLRVEIKSHLRNIESGFKLMTQTRMMGFVMVSIFVLFFVSGVGFSVLVPTIQQTFGMGTPGVTVMAVAVAVGMVLGPILTGVRGSAYPKHRLIISSFVVLGLLFGFAGASYLIIGTQKVLATPWLNWIMIHVMGLVVLVGGAVFGVINIAQDTMIQERISPSSRGRIFAWREVLASLAFVATAVPAGFVAEAVSFEYVLLVVGGIVVAFAITWAPLIWKSSDAESFSHGGLR